MCKSISNSNDSTVRKTLLNCQKKSFSSNIYIFSLFFHKVRHITLMVLLSVTAMLQETYYTPIIIHHQHQRRSLLHYTREQILIVGSSTLFMLKRHQIIKLLQRLILIKHFRENLTFLSGSGISIHLSNNHIEKYHISTLIRQKLDNQHQRLHNKALFF